MNYNIFILLLYFNILKEFKTNFVSMQIYTQNDIEEYVILCYIVNKIE